MTSRRNYFGPLKNYNSNSNHNNSNNKHNNHNNSNHNNAHNHSDYSKPIEIRETTKMSLETLIELQNRISYNIDWKRTDDNINTETSLKDIFYLNRKRQIDIEQKNFKRYFNFLLFCDNAVKEFKELGKNYHSFYISDLSDDDRSEFNKISHGYYDAIKHKSRMTAMDLIQINEKIIDNKTKNKYFDRMSESEIRAILQKRVQGLLECSQNKKKSAELQAYYKQEYEIERENIENPDFDISDLSDRINWGIKPFNADFSEEKIRDLYDLVKDNTEKIKRLATFLPFNCFILEPGKPITLNKDEFIDFMVDVGENKQNCQQLLFGFKDEILSDFFEISHAQLYLIISLINDKKNHCSILCDWNIYLNLLFSYMMSKSKSKLFPIIFKLPKNKYGFNSKSNSYSFRNSEPYLSNRLFDEYREFLGVHIFKYDKNGKQRLKFIFTFRNDEYGTESSDVYFRSQYSGTELKYFNTDYLLNSVEIGELFKSIGITHQEFYDLFKYHKLTPYIIGDNTTELFATRRLYDDPELQRLVKLLNMKPVKIIKEKIYDEGPARFSIIPYQNDSEINYERGSFFELTYIKKNTIAKKHREKSARRKGGSLLKNKKTKKEKTKKAKMQNKYQKN